MLPVLIFASISLSPDFIGLYLKHFLEQLLLILFLYFAIFKASKCLNVHFTLACA